MKWSWKVFLMGVVWTAVTAWSVWFFFLDVDQITSMKLPDWSVGIESDPSVLAAWKNLPQIEEVPRIYDEGLIANLATSYPTAYFAKTRSLRPFGGGEAAMVQWVVSVDGELVTYIKYAPLRSMVHGAVEPYIDETTHTLHYLLVYHPGDVMAAIAIMAVFQFLVLIVGVVVIFGKDF